MEVKLIKNGTMTRYIVPRGTNVGYAFGKPEKRTIRHDIYHVEGDTVNAYRKCWPERFIKSWGLHTVSIPIVRREQNKVYDSGGNWNVEVDTSYACPICMRDLEQYEDKCQCGAGIEWGLL